MASSLGAEGSKEFFSAWPFRRAPGAKQVVRRTSAPKPEDAGGWDAPCLKLMKETRWGINYMQQIWSALVAGAPTTTRHTQVCEKQHPSSVAGLRPPQHAA